MLVFAGLGFLAIWYWGVPNAEHVRREVAENKVETFKKSLEPDAGPHSEMAIAYAEAVRDGDCETVLSRLVWVQERLDMLRAEGATETAIENESGRLCESLLTRDDDRPVLEPEGLEDKYVFMPGSTIELLGSDDGREGLARPVARRVWLNVRYASPNEAVWDANGNGISGLIVGVSVTEEGDILKAGGVIGNLEIRLDAIQYSW